MSGICPTPRVFAQQALAAQAEICSVISIEMSCNCSVSSPRRYAALSNINEAYVTPQIGWAHGGEQRRRRGQRRRGEKKKRKEKEAMRWKLVAFGVLLKATRRLIFHCHILSAVLSIPRDYLSSSIPPRIHPLPSLSLSSPWKTRGGNAVWITDSPLPLCQYREF